MNNSSMYLVYSVFVSTFPGGSLLYSKMYGNSCDKVGEAGNAPDPMSFAALFYAIQTYANELCTNQPMSLKHFYQHGKIVCFKIYETFLVTAVLSMKVGSINGLNYCESIGNAFHKKINDEEFNIHAGKKLKGFKKHLKKSNMLLLNTLIKKSSSFLNFENIVKDGHHVKKESKDTTDCTKRYTDCIFVWRLNQSQSSRKGILKIENNTTITNTKQDTSLEPSFVNEHGQQTKKNKNSIFSGIRFFKRNRNGGTNTKMAEATNNTTVYKKKHQPTPSDNYKKHEGNDENNLLSNLTAGNILKISDLYIYHDDGNNDGGSLEKIDNSNKSDSNDDKLNNMITNDEEKLVTKYLEKYNENLDNDHFQWYSFKCHNIFIGYICRSLIIMKRYHHYPKMNAEDTTEQNTKNHKLDVQDNNIVKSQPPFPVDIMLTEKNINILDSINNGINSKQVGL